MRRNCRSALLWCALIDEVTMASKGELTAQRILDCAEPLFARKGFDACSLRDIARDAGIREPGVYNYFASKEALFGAVLERVMTPMAEMLEKQLMQETPEQLPEITSIMTDLFQAHPHAAAFFNQALTGDEQSAGTRLSKTWLRKLLRLGRHVYAQQQGLDEAALDNAQTTVHIIALFNLCSGYFLAQRAFDALEAGQLMDAESIARQKQLLQQILPTLGNVE
jgi:AcrR family transcriptional regulator